MENRCISKVTVGEKSDKWNITHRFQTILARFRCVCAELAESGYDNRTPHFLASLRLIAQKDRERKR